MLSKYLRYIILFVGIAVPMCIFMSCNLLLQYEGVCLVKDHKITQDNNIGIEVSCRFLSKKQLLACIPTNISDMKLEDQSCWNIKSNEVFTY